MSSSARKTYARHGAADNMVTSSTPKRYASLHSPVRPVTPKFPRSLFDGDDYAERPTSAMSSNEGSLDGFARPASAMGRAPTSLGRQGSGPLADLGSPRAGAARVRRLPALQPMAPDSPSPRPPPIPSRSAPSPRPGSATAPSPRPGSARSVSTDDSISTPRRATFSPEDAAWDDIQGLCRQLDPGMPASVLVETAGQLWHGVAKYRFRDEKERTRVLSAALKLMDAQNTQLLLRLCRIVLAIAEGGRVLLNACKLLFRLSKDERNDAMFRSERVIDTLLDVLSRPIIAVEQDGVARHELLTYCIGVLKNVTNASENQAAITAAGGVAVLAQMLSESHAQRLADAFATGRKALSAEESTEKVAQVLVQASAALRNLANGDEGQDAFVACGAAVSGVLLVQTFGKHAELMLNICRILSKLSLRPDCRAALKGEPRAIPLLLRLLELHRKKPMHAVRICFILGNLTTSDDDARLAVAADSGVKIILDVLDYYQRQLTGDNSTARPDTASSSRGGKANGKAGEKVMKKGDSDLYDVLTKLVRVIANMATHPGVGPAVAAATRVKHLHTILSHVKIEESEELVLNTVSAITNLSYYFSETNTVLQQQLKISRCLVPLLLHDNVEAVVESLRAFGNFSRDVRVQRLMRRHRVDEILVILLDHPEPEVVHTACGVLMNLVASTEHKDVLPRHGGVDRLIKLLQTTPLSEMTLATVLCKTLSNYLRDNRTWFVSLAQGTELCAALEGVMGRVLVPDRVPEENEGPDDALELASVAELLASTISAGLAAGLAAPSEGRPLSELEPLPGDEDDDV